MSVPDGSRIFGTLGPQSAPACSLLCEHPLHDDTMTNRSGASAWPVLRQFIDAEARIAARMSRRPATAALYEFLRFGMKQAWACLFGALMLSLLLATYFFYPHDAALARYDFLFLAALFLQVSLLGFGLETIEEAKVIAAYHVVGTVMEIFKTSVGSWVYPDDVLLSHRRRAAFFRLHVLVHRQLSVPSVDPISF